MDKLNPRILIVDDDPNQLEILSTILKLKGLEPVTALSGAEALAQVKEQRMDVALIDLRLEDMSGLDVLRGIKERSPETECILLTGHASTASAIEAIQMDAYGYFQKPFDIEQVLLSIQRALEKHIVEEALHESETRYRDLVENSQDLICTHDLQGNLLFVNEAGTKMSGYSNETLLKMNLRDMLAPEVRSRFDAYLAEIQAKGQAHGLMRIQTAAGEIRYLDFKNTLQTETLTAPIIRGTARDVTEREQAEEALKKSEKRFRALIEIGRDNISLLAADGTLLWESPSTSSTLGYAPNQFVGHNIFELMHPDDQGWTRDLYAQIVQTPGKSQDGIFRLRHSSGTWRWIESTTANMLNEPSVRAIVINYRDITERKQAEEALQEKEARYRSLFEQTHDAVFILDLMGNHISINQRAADMLGYTAVETQKLSVKDTSAEIAKSENILKRLIAGEQIPSYERLFRKKNGEVFPAEVSVELVRDSKGNPQHIQSVVRDITERKQAEEALKESQQSYQKLVEQIPGVIYRDALDENASTLFISPQIKDLTGYAPEEWLASPDMWSKLLHPDDRARVLAENKHHLATGAQFKSDYRLLARDGRIVWVRDEAISICDSSGRPLYDQGVFTDITERRQAEEALRKSEADLKEAQRVGRLGSWEWDAMTDAINWSEEYYRIYGFDPKQRPPGYEEHLKGYTPESAERLDAAVKKSMQTGIPYELDLEYACTDGARRWVTARSEIKRGANGQIVGLRGTAQDITERKQAEEKLRESEEMLRESQRLAGLGSYVLDFASGIWTSSNILDEIFGIDETYIRSIGNWAALIHPDDRDQMLNYFTNEIAGKLALFDKEYRIIRDKDKAERWVHGLGKLELDERNQPIRLRGTILDITERKHAEQALAASEAELRALFASMQDVVLVIDREGVYRKIAPTNPALLVRPADELLGRNLRDVFSAEQTRAFIDSMRQVLETSQTAHIEYALTIGGRMIWFSTSISPMTEESTLWVARDITERKQAEDEIRRHAGEFATLYESSQALAGKISLDDVLKDIIENARRLFSVTGVGMYLYDPAARMLEVKVATHPSIPIGTRLSLGEGLAGKVAQTRRSMRIDDYAAWEGRSSKYEGIPVRATLETPLIYQDRLIGVLVVHETGDSERKFTEADERLLSLFAAQAAAAIQNSRLFEETRQRVSELEVLNRVSVALRSIAKQDQMLAIVLEETLKALNAEHGSIQLWDKSTNSLRRSMARGWPAEVTEPPQELSEGVAGRVFTSGENYIAREFINDPATRDATRNQIPPGWGGICVPIRSAEHTLGTLIIAIPSERELNKDEIRLLNTLAEMTGASLHRMYLYEEAIHRMKDLQALRDVDQAITSNFDLRPTLDTVITHTIAQLRVDAADILLLRPHLQLLEYAAGQGFRTPFAKGASVRMGESLAGRAALERRTVNISHLADSQANKAFIAFWKSESFSSYYCVPLLAKGEVKGVLEVYKRNPLPPDPEWINYLETLASQAAIAIDSTQLFDNLQRANLELGVAYETTIESWSRALSLRDSETEGHTQRVTEMVTILAQSFNFSDEELQHIRRGAVLHDIGKMGVPDHILLKSGPLTEEEWGIMRKHPQLAYDMLKPIAYLHESLDIPYCHHEKWDGTGYPRGLAGDNIPLAARIFAIVDVYDATTSDRPYRPAWSNEKALEYIREQNGKHFDPQVVDKFMEIFGEKKR